MIVMVNGPVRLVNGLAGTTRDASKDEKSTVRTVNSLA
jgi:hypothetical protein